MTILLHLAAPMSSFIVSRYKLDSGPFMRELLRLEEMRGTATINLDPKRLASVDLILGYVRQLRALSRKFLIGVNANGSSISNGGSIKVQFAWHNAVPSTVDKEKPIASHELVYEELCCLFNASVIYWTLGNDDFCLDTPESLKRALTLFQKAAGLFLYIEERLVVEADRTSIPAASDLHCSGSLATLMQALGLECFVRTATVHERDPPVKPATLSRIAMTVAEKYDEGLRQCTRSLYSFAPAWKQHLEAKVGFWRALAEEHKAQDLLHREQHGEALARLGQAKQTLARLCNDKKLPESLRGEIGEARTRIDDLEHRATRENNLIYHCMLREYKELGALPVAQGLFRPSTCNATTFEGDEASLLFKGLPTLEAFRANEAAERAKATKVTEFNGKLQSLKDALQRALDQYAPVINCVLLESTGSGGVGALSLEQSIDGVSLSMSSVTLMRAESERMLRDTDAILALAPEELKEERGQYEQLKRTLEAAHDADRGIKQRFEALMEQAASSASNNSSSSWDVAKMADLKARVAALKAAYAMLNEESLRNFSPALPERLQTQALEQEQLINVLKTMAQEIQRAGSVVSKAKREQGRLSTLLRQMESDLGEGMTFYAGFQEAASKLLASVKDYEASKALQALDDLDLKDDDEDFGRQKKSDPKHQPTGKKPSPKPGQWNPSIPIKFNK